VLLLSSYAEPEIYKEVKQKLDDGSVKFEVTLDLIYNGVICWYFRAIIVSYKHCCWLLLRMSVS